MRTTRIHRHSRAPARLRTPISFAISSAFCVFVGCVYDPDNRCGKNQVPTPDDTSCVCASGYATTSSGCVACGKNEVSGPSGCVCESGYGRSGATEPCSPCGENAITNASGACECESGYKPAKNGCELIPAGLGAACDGEANSCTDETYSVCHLVFETEGYCTKESCSGAGDCTDGYACDTSGAVAYCRRPPVGAGAPCKSITDCENGEATYCDTYNEVCVVQGCSLSKDDCFPGTECCDLTLFRVPEPVCVPQGECTK
jgi:hypothetical protein